ncbi:MAG: DUF58 domain-containing protein [Desulfurococcales archaeon]|nr:DUF58 domain-containing protein [Desulfurococcales archaeon]
MKEPRLIARKLTPLGLGLALAGLLIAAWGLLEDSWQRTGLGLALAFTPLASGLLTHLAANELMNSLERRIPEVPVEGYVAPIILSVRNNSLLAPIIAEVEDTPPGNLRRIGSAKTRLIALPGTEARTTYYLVARPGKRAFAQVKAKAYDPLGLYELTIEWHPRGDSYLHGKPAQKKVELKESLEREISTLVRRYSRGMGLEFYEVREYREGDDPRLIDWKATARLGKLIVKEMARETSSPVIIMVAPGPEGDKGEPYKTPFERLSRIAAGLAGELSSKGITVGYIGLVEEPIIVPPSPGPRGLDAVLSGLAETPPFGEPPPDLAAVIRKYLRDFVRARPLLILLAPPEIADAIGGEARAVAGEANGKLVVMVIKDEKENN